MLNTRCRKAYVSVNVDIDEEGGLHPRLIRWKDGLVFQIDQVLFKCRAASKKVAAADKKSVMIREGVVFYSMRVINGS
jgi:hypothetical protein